MFDSVFKLPKIKEFNRETIDEILSTYDKSSPDMKRSITFALSIKAMGYNLAIEKLLELPPPGVEDFDRLYREWYERVILATDAEQE